MHDQALHEPCTDNPRDTAALPAEADLAAALRQVRDLLRQFPPTQPLPAILVLGPRTAARWISLQRSPLSIGRAAGNDVVLDDDGVSRQHCRLVTVGDAWLVEDSGGRNGVLHRGAKVSRLALRSGDALTLGSACVLFIDEVPATPAPGV